MWVIHYKNEKQIAKYNITCQNYLKQKISIICWIVYIFECLLFTYSNIQI